MRNSFPRRQLIQGLAAGATLAACGTSWSAGCWRCLKFVTPNRSSLVQFGINLKVITTEATRCGILGREWALGVIARAAPVPIHEVVGVGSVSDQSGQPTLGPMSGRFRWAPTFASKI